MKLEITWKPAISYHCTLCQLFWSFNHLFLEIKLMKGLVEILLHTKSTEFWSNGKIKIQRTYSISSQCSALYYSL